jgi:hypothetical protein
MSPSWPIPSEARWLEVNGYPLTYQDVGHGPAVVPVHGSIVDYHCWEPLDNGPQPSSPGRCAQPPRHRNLSGSDIPMNFNQRLYSRTDLRTTTFSPETSAGRSGATTEPVSSTSAHEIEPVVVAVQVEAFAVFTRRKPRDGRTAPQGRRPSLQRPKRQQLQGASFSELPGAVFVILQRGWLVATLNWVIVSPCLSYLLHGLLGTSFQSVHAVLPLTAHVPCNMPRPADL